jgi:uncharacterized MAPEG superfamily protein
MPYVDIVTALALFQFISFAAKVGSARGKYGIKAPATTGNEIFERHFRVQQNTLEVLIVVIPGLYIFSRYFNPLIAAALGFLYLVGRQLYAVSYVRDPAKRSLGFGLTMLPMMILIIGSVIGAVRQLLWP